MNRIEAKQLTGYEEDFALWSAEQATLLRAGRLDRVDLENVAEEIEGLARSDEYQILHRLDVLLAHLLKWTYQPAGRTNSWRATVIEQRARVLDLTNDSPSLRPYPATVLARAYVVGRYEAIRETGLAETEFPETCPWNIEQVLDPDFLPD